MKPIDGYSDAFYAVADMLGIVPDGVSSPREVFEKRMRPELARLIGAGKHTHLWEGSSCYTCGATR